MKKMIISYDNRTFEAYVGSLGLGLAEVSFYEVVRPTWKIFRTKFFPFGLKSFDVEEYQDIWTAVRKCLLKCLAEETRENEIAEKWKSFEKTLDKNPKV